jgi:high-affinity Fe2+/Pb2+ permease
MNQDAVLAVMEKLDKSHEAYAKGMELIGLVSAGTIGVVVVLRPLSQGGEAVEIKVAVVLLFIAVLSTIFWFMGKGNQQHKLANKILNAKPNQMVSVKEAWWTRTVRILALSTFICAYYYLFNAL